MLKIELLCLDVDGCLTDGIYNVSDKGDISKNFYTRDIWAVEEVLKAGIPVQIISQSTDECILRKMHSMSRRHPKNLRIKIGARDKRDWIVRNYIQNMFEHNCIAWLHIAYFGDAEVDLECIEESEFGGCPSDAVPIVKKAADYICKAPGGRGAVYEFIQKVLPNV